MELVAREDIKLFVDACDKMIGSKYIMVDKRVSEVLTSIAGCKPVYNLIAECMINFNFDKAYKQGTNGNTFLLPDDPKDVVAFVFCLLNCLDDKKININDLLMKYYSKDNQVSPYALFNSEVIARFKNAVYFLAVGEKIEKQEEKAQARPVVNFDADVNNRIIFLVKDLKDYVAGLKKIKGSFITKSEMITMLLVFVDLVKNNQTYAYQSALIGIKAGAGKDKEMQKRIGAIEDILLSLLVD